MDSQPVCMQVVMRYLGLRQDIRRGIRYAIRDMGWSRMREVAASGARRRPLRRAGPCLAHCPPLSGSLPPQVGPAVPTAKAITHGNLGRQRARARCKFRYQRPAVLHNLAGQQAMAGRVDTIRATAHDRHRAPGTHRTAMSGRINAQRQATDNDKATTSQLAGKAAAVVDAVRRGCPLYTSDAAGERTSVRLRCLRDL